MLNAVWIRQAPHAGGRFRAEAERFTTLRLNVVIIAWYGVRGAVFAPQ